LWITSVYKFGKEKVFKFWGSDGDKVEEKNSERIHDRLFDFCLLHEKVSTEGSPQNAFECDPLITGDNSGHKALKEKKKKIKEEEKRRLGGKEKKKFKIKKEK